MIIATAGHVDHGKTALVKALAGVDTDRLAEEKRRGLTIEPGFAYRHLDCGGTLGFVDVPGHERFVRNMLAGVAAVDAALLVIAADDGIMPQTREHLDILNLLGVSEGVIALTKTDLVDQHRSRDVTASIPSLLSGTVLEDAPIFPVSATTGEGMDDLGNHLIAMAKAREDRISSGEFRFSIDRAFTLKGAGLVVTGAVVSGQADSDTDVMLSPQGTMVRIRSIRAHDRETMQARAGQRCALNISARGLHKDHIQRGDWIVSPSLHAPVQRIDARIRLLDGESKFLGRGSEVHVHLGAAETMGLIAILDKPRLSSGEEGYAQITLERPHAVLTRDRLILRDKSASRTIGGGHVVDPFARAKGRASTERLAILSAMDTPSPDETLAGLLAIADNEIDLASFALSWNLAPDEMDGLLKRHDLVEFPSKNRPMACASGLWEKVCEQVTGALDGSTGMAKKYLRAAISAQVSVGLLSAVLQSLVDTGKVAQHKDTYTLAGHGPDAGPNPDQSFWDLAFPVLDGGGLKPPTIKELSASLAMQIPDVRKRLHRLSRQGLVQQVSETRYFLPDQVNRLAEHARETSMASMDGRFTTGDFRDHTGIGRNLAIEVLEYFDKNRITSSDSDGYRRLC